MQAINKVALKIKVLGVTVKSIKVDIAAQTLFLYEDDDLVFEALVSTGKCGVGEQNGSEQTPRGAHIIRAKIGESQPINTVFIGRRPSGELYSPALAKYYPERDWILSRILWLSGTEAGKNRLGNLDTMRRYIYIHGAPDDAKMGVPGSHGCIRMHNQDLITLFEQVDVGTALLIS